MNPSIYLAGPIRDGNEDDIRWRRIVTSALQDNYRIFDPTYGKVFDKEKGIWTQEKTGFILQNVYFEDKSNIQKADILLVNILHLGDGYPTIGTLWECGMATALGKLLVVVCDPKYEKHPFIQMNSIVYYTLSDAVKYLNFMQPRFSGYNDNLTLDIT